ncbi:MAG: DUF481 domain-containing protein [Desulfobacterales bacterium]|nr:DUF481 domain-containing protein [Desulfobacterales bacterium]
MISRVKWVSSLAGIVLSLCLIFFGNVFADEIYLKNGDKLSGTVKNLDAGVLTFQTEYSELIKIQKEKIEKISTDTMVELYMTSGEIIRGKLETMSTGQLIVESSAVRASSAIDWLKVERINPPPKDTDKWHGNINLGGSLQTGNTDRTSAAVGAEAFRKTERDRFTIRFLYNYAEEDNELAARSTFGAFKYDYFFTQALYGYLAVDLLSDEFKDLTLRTVVGPGVGYQIWDDNIKQLLFEAGLAYFSEDLDEGEDDQWITARIAAYFHYQLTDSFGFSDQITIYPNIEDGGEFQLRNEASITSMIGGNWALRFSNIIEHDSDPPDNVKENDIYWLISLQYQF